MLSNPAVKHWLDGAAIATGIMAFFKAVPWPEIAGFLSCIWLLIQIAHWLYKRYRHKGN